MPAELPVVYQKNRKYLLTVLVGPKSWPQVRGHSKQNLYVTAHWGSGPPAAAGNLGPGQAVPAASSGL